MVLIYGFIHKFNIKFHCLPSSENGVGNISIFRTAHTIPE